MRLDDFYLVDIIEAAEDLARILAGKTKEEFETEIVLSSATQYLLIKMGEACGKLQPASLAEMPDQPVHQVRGFRNRLVHGYFDVDLEIVLAVAQQHAPILAKAAEEALAKLFPDTYLKLQERRGGVDGEKE